MLHMQETNQVVDVEARAGGDVAAEDSNPIPVGMGSLAASGGQDLQPGIAPPSPWMLATPTPTLWGTGSFLWGMGPSL